MVIIVPYINQTASIDPSDTFLYFILGVIVLLFSFFVVLSILDEKRRYR